MEFKGFVVLVGFVILIASLGYVYYTYELPKQRLQDEVSNISIIAREGNQIVKTGYVLEYSGQMIEGNTSYSYELEQLPKGQIVTLSNKNIEGQSYFTDKRTLNLSDDLLRVDLKLESPKPINLEVVSLNPLIVEVMSEDARNVMYCLDWSLNYIFVESNDTLTDTPKEYKEYEDCYYLTDSLNQSQKIHITYSLFGNVNNNDYIRIVLFQKDLLGIEDKIQNLI